MNSEQSVNLGSERNKIHPDSVRGHGQPGQQAGQRPQQAVQTGGRHAQVSCPLHQVDRYHSALVLSLQSNRCLT